MNKNENIIINKKFFPNNEDIEKNNKEKDNSNFGNEANNLNKENNYISEIKNHNLNINLSEINEEREKEFFSNSPIIYFFIKILLLFEGQITRILLQIGDFYCSGIITNIYLQIILIQICGSATSGAFAKIYAFFSGLIFCFLMKIIVTIAYWELYQLKWFELNPFDSITNILNIKLKNYMKRNIYYIVNIVFGILFWLFIIGLLTMSYNNGKLIDIVNFIIFVVIPMLKFLILYLSYIYICIKNLIFGEKNEERDDNPFQYWIKLSNLIDQGILEVNNKKAVDKTKDENMNCFEKFFFKDIVFQKKICKGKILKITLKTILEIIFTLLSFAYIIFLFIDKGATASSVFFLLFTYLFSLIITIQFPTPLWFINSIYRWYLKIKKKYERSHQIKCRVFNEKYAAFKVLDTLPLIISIIFWIILIFTIIIFNLSDSFFINAQEKINQEREFKETNWPREYFSEIKNIENAICFTDIHGLSILKITSLAFAAYMNDPENIITYYEKSFFKEKIENITEMRFLDRDSKYSVVLMINLDIPNEKPLTVFSVQASIKQLDYWLDLEIFCSSAILSIIRILTINSLESLTSNAIIWLLTIPIRILEKFTLFKVYIEHLTKDIDKEIQKINGERNIIFTGHSLGGGMAKYLGLKYHKENVAVSGPGITPLEYKFKKSENYYRYFKSNLIDIVPDNDIVPRLEISGGVRYRVLCEKGYVSCHQIDRILCQIGATCRREDLSGDICISIFGNENYEEIRKLAGIHTNIPEEY